MNDNNALFDGPTTDDGFLNGRLRILQPRDGYRAAIDPVFLAAAVDAQPEQRILDLGCGVGTAGLCLLARQPTVRVVGLDVQNPLVLLARQNASRNEMADRLDVFCGDALALAGSAAKEMGAPFDHVMTNPPYLDPKRTNRPPNPMKAIANVEPEGGVRAWLAAALRLLRPKGQLSLIHRADRLADLLAALGDQAGAVRVYPLWPDANTPARRVIVVATKGSSTPLSLMPGLTLHELHGGYTAQADRVLRDGGKLAE